MSAPAHKPSPSCSGPTSRGPTRKRYLVEQKNLTSVARHPGYQGVMHARQAGEEAYAVFRLDAPRDLTRIEYGGRLYNRAPHSRIDFLHSFDGGQTWTQSYSLTNTAQPWDVIHYESVEAVPPGTRSVWFKYRLQSSAAGPDACSLYAVRMEANHQPAEAGFRPLEVTFNWSERQADYSLVERSHTEVVTKLPHRYFINVGGADHPVMNSLRITSPRRRWGGQGGLFGRPGRRRRAVRAALGDLRKEPGAGQALHGLSALHDAVGGR